MQKTISRNPWLDIPPDDYENHMSSPEVQQLQALNTLFKKVLDTVRPSSLAVIGCTTGNGFEHIDTRVTKRIVGIDINAAGLERFEQNGGIAHARTMHDRRAGCRCRLRDDFAEDVGLGKAFGANDQFIGVTWLAECSGRQDNTCGKDTREAPQQTREPDERARFAIMRMQDGHGAASRASAR